jgi:hypothetical protein
VTVRIGNVAEFARVLLTTTEMVFALGLSCYYLAPEFTKAFLGKESRISLTFPICAEANICTLHITPSPQAAEVNHCI